VIVAVVEPVIVAVIGPVIVAVGGARPADAAGEAHE
jgi:hypothetical protein